MRVVVCGNDESAELDLCEDGGAGLNGLRECGEEGGFSFGEQGVGLLLVLGR